MAGPGVYATGEDRGVRPYGSRQNPAARMVSSNDDLIAAEDAGLARADELAGMVRGNDDLIAAEDAGLARADELAGGVFTEYGPAREYYMKRLGGHHYPGIVDEDLGLIKAEMQGGGRLYGADIGSMARAASRQAITMGIDNNIMDSPDMAAEQSASRADDAAMLDLMAEEEKQAASAEEQRAQAEAFVEGMNRVLESPIGKLIQSQMAGQQIPVAADSPLAVTPKSTQPKTEDIRNRVGSNKDGWGLIGDYSTGAPTYTAPKQAGNIGVIDLSNKEIDRSTPRNAEQAVAMADEAFKRGNTEGAMWNLQLANRMQSETAKSQLEALELLEKKLGVQKATVDLDTAKKTLEQMDNPGSLNDAPFEQQRLAWQASDAMLADARQSIVEALSKNTALLHDLMRSNGLNPTSDGVDKVEFIENYATKALRQNDDLRFAFEIRDIAGQAIVDRANKSSTARTNKPTPPEDRFRTPRAE